MSDPTRTYFDVLLPLPLTQASYTYFIESGEEQDLMGALVLVPFGRGKTLTGVVTKVHGTRAPLPDVRYKRILLRLPYPALPQEVLRLWEWVAQYYLCTRGEVFAAAVPRIFRPDGEQQFSFVKGYVPTDELAPFALDHETFTLRTLRKEFPHHYTSLLAKLLEESSIELHSSARIYAPQWVEGWLPDKDFMKDRARQEAVKEQLERSPASLKALDLLLRKSATETPLSLKAWSEELGVSPYVINKLRELEILVKGRAKQIEEVPTIQLPTKSDGVDALPHFEVDFQGSSILLVQRDGSRLLERVPWQLLQTEVERHRQVLLLFPNLEALELASPHLSSIVAPNSLHPYHSNTTERRRHQSWLSALKGEPGIYVGLRSAVWLPFTALSLVTVIDEEDKGYRQFEPAPRFTASNVALVLASMHGARTLLISATPSVESHMQVVKGRYAHLSSPVLRTPPEPERHFVSMNKAFEKDKVRGRMLSFEMIRAIEEALYEGGQALLLYQRRGYARRATCDSCGASPTCPECHTTFRYYQSTKSLVCPLCGYHMALPELCPTCREGKLELTGTGIERLAQSVKQIFRNVAVSLVDEGEPSDAPILLSSSYEPPLELLQRATTIGIVQLDLLATQLDFRAGERTFRFLTKCHDEAPQLRHYVVQYFAEGHNALEAFQKKSYDEMVHHELAERHLILLPPFSRLIDLYFESTQRAKAQEVALAMRTKLTALCPTCSILGPAPLPVHKRETDIGYKLTLIVPLELPAMQVREKLSAEIDNFLKHYRGPQLRIYFDVDPQ
ncbi:MAG: hypothetical protein Q4D93_06120 [Porphyromonas sp.]|nr:hypothetical protein [Porphyromonas sp.]